MLRACYDSEGQLDQQHDRSPLMPTAPIVTSKVTRQPVDQALSPCANGQQGDMSVGQSLSPQRQWTTVLNSVIKHSVTALLKHTSAISPWTCQHSIHCFKHVQIVYIVCILDVYLFSPEFGFAK